MVDNCSDLPTNLGSSQLTIERTHPYSSVYCLLNSTVIVGIIAAVDSVIPIPEGLYQVAKFITCLMSLSQINNE